MPRFLTIGSPTSHGNSKCYPFKNVWAPRCVWKGTLMSWQCWTPTAWAHGLPLVGPFSTSHLLERSWAIGPRRSGQGALLQVSTALGYKEWCQRKRSVLPWEHIPTLRPIVAEQWPLPSAKDMPMSLSMKPANVNGFGKSVIACLHLDVKDIEMRSSWIVRLGPNLNSMRSVLIGAPKRRPNE